MRRRMKLALAILVFGCLLSGHYSSLNAQVNSVEASPEDTEAIEAIVHSNPSDHVTEDVSFTNIFGTVRYGRAEFVKRHIEIANTIFKGTTPKSSIAKLRFVRQEVAIADVSREITRFPKTPPAGVPVGGVVSSCPHQRTRRLVDHGIPQCRRHTGSVGVHRLNEPLRSGNRVPQCQHRGGSKDHGRA